MEHIVTLAERQAWATKHRAAAIGAAIERLRAYAQKQGGRYLVFGSAALGEVRSHSDLDVIVDFPQEKELEAFLQAEIICVDLDLPYDMHFMPRRPTAFIERVKPKAIELS